MKTISTGSLSGERVAKRIVFLAYEPSAVVGLGVLQARSGVTEESLGACIWKDQVDADYIAGRMVKLWGMSFGPNSITFNDELVPRADYQSWCWKYPTYEALVMAAIESLQERAAQDGDK